MPEEPEAVVETASQVPSEQPTTPDPGQDFATFLQAQLDRA